MPANMKKAGKKYMYGGMKKKKMSKGGSLKPVPKDNKGLGKLPEDVRNKMGYMMYGGSKIKKMKPYKYGGKKVPGMFEDDRMMYGGMKKKRMQIGGEQDPGPPVSIDEREKRRGEKNKGTDTVAAKPKHNWNDKLTKLSNKRRDSKAKDEKKGKKSRKTKRIQKRINKEYKKINP
jgi:hypothetical protein